MNNAENIDALVAWMQAPAEAKPVLAFDALGYLDRLQHADLMMRMHRSADRAITEMVARFGASPTYGKEQATRDVDHAKLLFATTGSLNLSEVVCKALYGELKRATGSKRMEDAAKAARLIKQWSSSGAGINTHWGK